MKRIPFKLTNDQNKVIKEINKDLISKDKMFYEKKLSKHKGQMRWLVIERPTGSILCASTFEDEAKKVADFQNKHKQWVPQGGVIKHLTLGKI